MLLFGHLGIGARLAAPFGKIPVRPLLLGTLLPDLIDKPLYYGLVFATGKRGAELGLISGTRTFGHTGILLSVMLFAATLRQSRGLASLAIGMATHLFLDALTDQILRAPESAAWMALVFPFAGLRFAVIPFADVKEHLSAHLSPYTFATETLGAISLAWQYWLRERRSEVIAWIRSRRAINAIASAGRKRRRRR